MYYYNIKLFYVINVDENTYSANNDNVMDKPTDTANNASLLSSSSELIVLEYIPNEIAKLFGIPMSDWVDIEYVSYDIMLLYFLFLFSTSYQYFTKCLILLLL
jgi:hypothetical protein